MKVEIIGQKMVSEESLPDIVNQIFAICKSDPNFPLKDKVESVEFTIETLKKKIEKQNHLLEKAKKIEQDATKKYTMLESKNFETKAKILESIGSEI